MTAAPAGTTDARFSPETRWLQDPRFAVLQPRDVFGRSSEAVDLPLPETSRDAPHLRPILCRGGDRAPIRRRTGGRVLSNRIFEAWAGENAELRRGQPGFGLVACMS